jgi:hypothetical protein
MVLPVKSPGSSHRSRAFLGLIAIVFSISFAGCPCLNSAVNADPALRWWLFSNFGASKICPEMTKQGVSLRLQDRAPAMGRFFPMQCSVNIDNQRQVIAVSVNGTGYGYMSPAKRVGFALSATVEYRMDFNLAGDDMYLWAKLNRIVDGPHFQLGYIENGLVNIAANVPPFGNMADFLGNQVVSTALMRGFTVVHNDDKGNDFTLGLIFPPSKPNHPFQATNADRFTFANESIEVHAGERDYLGPFEITDASKALYLTLSNNGPAVDVMIVDKVTGDVWRDMYQTGKPLGPPLGPILAGGPLNPTSMDNRRYQLAPGLYYVVIDNTAAAGLVSPPMSLNPLADAVAQIGYVAQTGN